MRRWFTVQWASTTYRTSVVSARQVAHRQHDARDLCHHSSLHIACPAWNWVLCTQQWLAVHTCHLVKSEFTAPCYFVNQSLCVSKRTRAYSTYHSCQQDWNIDNWLHCRLHYFWCCCCWQRLWPWPVWGRMWETNLRSVTIESVTCRRVPGMSTDLSFFQSNAFIAHASHLFLFPTFPISPFHPGQWYTLSSALLKVFPRRRPRLSPLILS